MQFDASSIERLARALIASQGREAAEVAEKVVRNFEQSSDKIAAEKWRRVIEAVKRLLAAAMPAMLTYGIQCARYPSALRQLYETGAFHA